MKSISPIKFFTAVGFLVVSLMGLNLMAQADSKKTTGNKEECIAKKARELKQKCNSESDPTKKQACLANANTDATDDAECGGLQSKSERDSEKSECNSAFDKFKEAQSKATGACEAYAQTTESKDGPNTCENRMKACRNKISSAADATSSNGTQDLMNTLFSMYMQKKNPGQNPNDFAVDKGTSGRSCSNYKSKDERKEQKTEKKDIEKEIKQLNKDIAEEKKKINDENAKLREKNAEIDTELQKVDEAMKKAIRSVDEKKAANLKKINDDLAKNAISIRNLNSVIIKRKEDVETAKFDYSERMKQFTQDKISTQCNAAIDTAKQCFLKSSKGQTTNDPKDPCGGFTFSGKGAKGTAQLKAKIQKVREACFEQANMSVNKAKFEQSKTLRTVETDIIEKTNQVQDANNDIAQKQKNMVADNEGSDKERTDEEKNAEKQVENFKLKLDGISKSIREAVMLSNEKIEQFKKEIDDAKIRQLAVKMGVLEPEDLNNALGDAEEVVGTREAAREQAITACCSKDKPVDLNKNYSSAELKKMDSRCSTLVSGSIKQEDTKGYAAPGTTK